MKAITIQDITNAEIKQIGEDWGAFTDSERTDALAAIQTDIQALVLTAGVPMSALLAAVASGVSTNDLSAKMFTDDGMTFEEAMKEITGKEMQHDSDPAAPPLPNQELAARLAELEAENMRLKARQNQKLTMKVGEKGGLSVYGLGRWPITLYREQWDRFIPFVKSGMIEDFIKENSAVLKFKE